MHRRDFLRLTTLLASASALSACAPAYRAIGGPAESALDGAAPALPWAEYAGLNRLSFGPRRADSARVAQIGLAAWIEEQLSPESLDDGPLDWRLRPYSILHETADDMFNRGERLFNNFTAEPVLDDLRAVTLLRQVYSRRQLYEVMVEFWTDHFNISMDKEDVWYLKPVDDREVVRPHAFGNFRDLLQASAHSPAMLTYLDNQANRAGAPNENYARELMELHSLGVDGGYTQDDVMELARCLTGWTVKQRFWRGEFEFDPDLHDQGAKTVLGVRVPPGGISEAESVIDRLAEHPSTARHIARKLARRFIADEPPHDLVERAAAAYLDSGGEIRPVLRTLLLDGLLPYGEALPPKFRRPVHFVAAALRTLNAETDGRGGERREFARTLSRLGQPPYQWPTPDGPPDTTGDWMGNLLPRWNFAGRLARGEIEGTELDVRGLVETSGADGIEGFITHLAPRLYGWSLDPADASSLAAALRNAGAGPNLETARVVIAGMLSAPAFQWR